MTVYKTVSVDVPGAKELAELRAIQHDLRWVEGACERLVSLWKHLPLDSVLSEALSVSALVKYSRCFSSGVRPRVPRGIVESLAAPARDAHEYFRHLRDKHFAHSVNPFEENLSTVVVPEEDVPGYEIGSIGFSQRSVCGLSDQQAEILSDLARRVSGAVEGKVETLAAQVLSEVKHLPIKELTQRDLIGGSVPDVRAVSRSRKA